MPFSDVMDLARTLARLGLSTASAAPNVEKMNDALLKDRTIFLGKAIDDATANEVIAKLLFLEMESPKKPIQLYINSPGGLVLAGLAIMDTMDRVRAPIATHCLGTAHSMAAVILACGRAGARSADAKSVITFTLPCAPDDADEQKKKDAVRLGEILISKTATATKRPIDTIRNYFYDGTAFSAQDAVAHGMIDRIISVAR